MIEIINNPALECPAHVLIQRYATEIAEDRIWWELELDENSVSGDPQAFEVHVARIEKDGKFSLFTAVITNLGPGMWTIEEIADDPLNSRCGFSLRMLQIQKRKQQECPQRIC